MSYVDLSASEWEKQQTTLLSWVREVKAFLDEMKYYVHSYFPEMEPKLVNARKSAEQLEKEITELGH